MIKKTMANTMKNIVLLISLLIVNLSFAQKREVVIKKIEQIKYYYVYTACDLETNETFIILGCKNNDSEFVKVKLDLDKKYLIEYRYQSFIKIDEKKYIRCIHTRTIINNIAISDKGNIPLLITKYKNILWSINDNGVMKRLMENWKY